MELMRLMCDDLGLSLRPVPYSGDDFDGIFAGLEYGNYDAVISGTTITPEREKMALFSAPYLQFDQGLAVNVGRNPKIKTFDDLRGLVVGIQVGNTRTSWPAGSWPGAPSRISSTTLTTVFSPPWTTCPRAASGRS